MIAAPVAVPTEPHNPTHLSASSIRDYLDCPRRFYWQRVAGIVLPPNPEMRFGRAVHAALEAYHAPFAVGDAPDPCDVFLARWREDATDLDPAYVRSMRLAGVELLALYLADPLDSTTPEQQWRVGLPGLDVPAVGIFDLASVDDDAGHLGEHKTALWPWKPDRLERQYQGAFYAACSRAMRGPLPQITYTILSVNPKPALQRLVYQATKEDADKAIETARVCLAGMREGHWPARCKPEYCSFPELCRRGE